LLVRLIGVVLIVAATLKVSGVRAASVAAQADWFANLVSKGAIATGEFALGAWFISGIAVLAARWTAAVLFLAFAIISASAALAGATSCGCMGNLTISPWIIFGFDLTVLFLLLFLRFKGAWQPADRFAIRLMLGTGVACSLGVLILSASFGSLASAWASMKNQPIAIDPVVVSLGDCKAGEQVEAHVAFTNLTGERIQVILVQSDCSCVSADVPAWIEPGHSQSVRLQLIPPKDSGPFVRRVNWKTTIGDRRGEVHGFVASSTP
jgi:hypothetical protein